MDRVNNSFLIVDTDALRHNAQAILRSLPASTALIPVLKADAYGLGLARVAQILAENDGIRLFAVSQVSEGRAMREAGVEKDVLVMGNALSFQIPAALEADLILTAGRPGLVPLLAREAVRQGKKARVQVKVETGLHRIGLAPGEELDELIRELKEAGGSVTVTGAFSHFSDAGDPEVMEAQYRKFLAGVGQLAEAGIPVPMRHISSSAASERAPQYDLEGVRIGRRLYMDAPVSPKGDIREVATWRGYVTQVHERKKGDTLGYDGQYRLPSDAVVATLSVGYGDGLSPALASARAPVLIGGKRCPLLAVCMDQCFADVTGAACGPGTEVTFFGRDRQGNFLSSQEVALYIGNDEGCGLTGALSPRVARVYGDPGEDPVTM